MKQPDYNCAQSELYGVGRLGWVSYAEFLADFSAIRGYYTGPYGVAARAQLDAAAALPDSQARNAVTEGYRVELTHLGDACLDRWQILKRIATTSFPPDMLKNRLEAAGSMYYQQAANHNWDKLSSLNESAATFMVTYNAELSADDNMPDSFPTDYETDMTAFSAKLLQFLHSEAIGKIETANKITANNTVYEKLMNMFKDGQEIFKDNPEVKDLFTFSTLLEQVSGHGQAGLRGLLKSALDAQPVSEAVVMILETSDTTNGEPDGHYLLKPVPSGTYTVRVTAPGYRDKVIHNVVISIGVVSTLDIELDPE